MPYTIDEVSSPSKKLSIVDVLKSAEELQSKRMMEHPYSSSGNYQSEDMYSRTFNEQSPLDKFLIGAGGGIYGLAKGPGMSKEDVQDYKNSMSGVSGLPGKLGQFLGIGAPSSLTLALPGGQSILGSMMYSGVLGAMMPAEDAKERAGNIAASSFGDYVGGRVGSSIGRSIADNTGRKLSESKDILNFNMVNQQTLEDAHNAGYVFTPSAFGKSSLPESFSGQIKTQQAMAWKNQKLTDRLMRQEFGLPEDAPLVSDTFRKIKDEAGDVYRQIAGMGEFSVTKEQAAALGQGVKTKQVQQHWFGDVGDNYPGKQKLVIDAGDALERLKQMRFDYHEKLNEWRASGGNPEARNAMVSARDAMKKAEEAIDANVPPVVLRQLVEARKRIAMAYDAIDAIKDASGHVDALKLAKQYEDGQKGYGPRLTGNMALIGKTASAFKEGMRMRSFKPLPNSALDAGVATIAGSAGVATGNPLALGAVAVPYARNPVRNWLMSPEVQAKLVKPEAYIPGSFAKNMPTLASPMLRTLGVTGLLGYTPE